MKGGIGQWLGVFFGFQDAADAVEALERCLELPVQVEVLGLHIEEPEELFGVKQEAIACLFGDVGRLEKSHFLKFLNEHRVGNSLLQKALVAVGFVGAPVFRRQEVTKRP